MAATLVALLCAGAIVYAATRGDETAPAARSTSSWGALTPSPLARTEVGAARAGDRIYLVGGFDSTEGTTGAVARYDISADRWEESRRSRSPSITPASRRPRAASTSTEAT